MSLRKSKDEETGESCEPTVCLTLTKLMSGNCKCKSIAVMCMADTGAKLKKRLWWFCLLLAYLISFALSSECTSTVFYPEVDSDSFNNSLTQRTTSPIEREGSRDG